MHAARGARSRAADRVRRLGAASDDDRALRTALLEDLRRSVPFDAYAWVLTDPETEVGSSPLAVVPDLSELPTLIRLKYLTPLNRWTSLATPVATLNAAAEGHPERSRLWRELLRRHAVRDVASVVLRDGSGCWGFLDLWRAGPSGGFTTDEVTHLTAVAGPFTEAVRRCQAATFADVVAAPHRTAPVVLVLSPTLEVRAQTDAADEHLRALLPTDADRRPVPAAAYNVAAQLLAIEAGVDGHPASARVHLGGGHWSTLRAARVGSGGSERPGVDRDIAVSIETASPSERRSLFVRAHALSQRESEVLLHLVTGADTHTIARRMFLSEHTVQDHLKSVFAKTGAHHRRGLLARVNGH